MKYLTLIWLFYVLQIGTASCQAGSDNRKKVIDMLLSQSRKKVNTSDVNRNENIYTITSSAPSSSRGFRSVSTIPKYCLAKGAVICRLEEYVQLHSPFKLNIGVGGE